VLVNFKDWVTDEYELQIPADLISKWKLKDGNYKLADQLYGVEILDLVVSGGAGKVKISLKPLESFILKLEI
jgi:hypothetical protein